MIGTIEIEERKNKEVFINDLFKTKKVVEVKLTGETNYHSFTYVIFVFDDQTELSVELQGKIWTAGLQIGYKSIQQVLNKKLKVLTSFPTK